MQKMLFSLIILLLASPFVLAEPLSIDQKITSIIPMPNEINYGPGYFIFNNKTQLTINHADALVVAQYFEHFINPATGLSLTIKQSKLVDNEFNKNSVNFLIDKSIQHNEGYSIHATTEHITIKAKTSAGLFYAVQSLRQLLPVEIETRYPINNVKWQIPSVTIVDQPRFSYRGMHLDVGRHLFSVSFIKKYIDLIALHKLNRFHWHLTEDQGWRIEIKKYPKLTQISAYREGTVYGNKYDDGNRHDNVRYGGYYSQSEIKDIVSYAQERHVTIIPEIDLPGHSVAALAAYPELACTDETFKVLTTWGVSKDVYCPSEQTFTFIENVLNEVMDLFPSEYIHIGGDEAPKDRWKTSSLAQQVIKDNNLKDEHELQSYFIKRIEKILNKRQRKLIGWDEILEGGLSPTATVMFWRSWGQHKNNLKTVLDQGNPVIMTPSSHMYFDHYQSESMDEPKAWGSYLPLKKVYAYDPVFEGLTKQQAQQIMGAQGNVWTEYIHTERMVEYRTQPRMAAVGELTWSASKDKNWQNFVARLTNHFKRLKVMEVNASTSLYNVHGELNENKSSLSLITDSDNHQIRFTTDGSKPTHQSALYSSPIQLDQTVHIRATAEDRVTKAHYGDYRLSYIDHLAKGKAITFGSNTPAKYHKNWANALTDGFIAHNRHQMRLNGRWIGTKGHDVEAIIDLEKKQLVQQVSFGFQPLVAIRLQSPEKVSIAVSNDKVTWQTVVEQDTSMASTNGQSSISLEFNPISARYIKINSVNGYRYDEFIVE